MAKRNSKFNLGYFCSLKNIVPIILVAIIVFFVFNLLQNKSFNPLFEGMNAAKLDSEVKTEENTMISKLQQRIDRKIEEHEENHTDQTEYDDHVFDSSLNVLNNHVSTYHTTPN